MSQFKPHAFPFDSDRQSRGMTLRDYFAAQAMNAYFDGEDAPAAFAMIAARSYRMADAMLKAREEFEL
jgi:hypothetical protein